MAGNDSVESAIVPIAVPRIFRSDNLQVVVVGGVKLWVVNDLVIAFQWKNDETHVLDVKTGIMQTQMVVSILQPDKSARLSAQDFIAAWNRGPKDPVMNLAWLALNGDSQALDAIRDTIKQ